MRSIRRTLLWRVSAGALVLLLLGGVLLGAGVRWLLTEQFDATLRTKLATFATLLEQDGLDIEIGFVDQAMPEFSAASEPEYIQLWFTSGEPMYRSPSLEGSDLPMFSGTETAPRIQDLELPDGRAGRGIGAEFEIHHYTPDPESPGPARVVLVLARGRAELDRAFALLSAGTVSGIVLLLGVGFLLGRSAVGRGLRPLEDLARHVSRIDDPRVAAPFQVAEVPDELAPLAESHNQMLARIRTAFERERRTTANIAHELRTPVTELMILAETAQRGSADPQATRQRLGELRKIGEQMSILIATLLELARMESGQVPLEIEPIDLAEIVRASWTPLSAASSARGQTFVAPLGHGPVVRADRVALSILLGNLLGNAVEHAPPGDRIGCELSNGHEPSWLVISNAANGLGPQDLDQLTEPFWRASRSREDRSHAGLGLSLAKRLAELLALDLLFSVEDGVFRARLSFRA
ncbi:MAG: sensor histidine kinase [Planctomycetota bacterium]